MRKERQEAIEIVRMYDSDEILREYVDSSDEDVHPWEVQHRDTAVEMESWTFNTYSFEGAKYLEGVDTCRVEEDSVKLVVEPVDKLLLNKFKKESKVVLERVKKLAHLEEAARIDVLDAFCVCLPNGFLTLFAKSLCSSCDFNDLYGFVLMEIALRHVNKSAEQLKDSDLYSIPPWFIEHHTKVKAAVARNSKPPSQRIRRIGYNAPYTPDDNLREMEKLATKHWAKLFFVDEITWLALDDDKLPFSSPKFTAFGIRILSSRKTQKKHCVFHITASVATCFLIGGKLETLQSTTSKIVEGLICEAFNVGSLEEVPQSKLQRLAVVIDRGYIALGKKQEMGKETNIVQILAKHRIGVLATVKQNPSVPFQAVVTVPVKSVEKNCVSLCTYGTRTNLLAHSRSRYGMSIQISRHGQGKARCAFIGTSVKKLKKPEWAYEISESDLVDGVPRRTPQASITDVASEDQQLHELKQRVYVLTEKQRSQDWFLARLFHATSTGVHQVINCVKATYVPANKRDLHAKVKNIALLEPRRVVSIESTVELELGEKLQTPVEPGKRKRGRRADKGKVAYWSRVYKVKSLRQLLVQAQIDVKAAERKIKRKLQKKDMVELLAAHFKGGGKVDESVVEAGRDEHRQLDDEDEDDSDREDEEEGDENVEVCGSGNVNGDGDDETERDSLENKSRRFICVQRHRGNRQAEKNYQKMWIDDSGSDAGESSDSLEEEGRGFVRVHRLRKLKRAKRSSNEIESYSGLKQSSGGKNLRASARTVRVMSEDDAGSAEGERCCDSLEKNPRKARRTSSEEESDLDLEGSTSSAGGVARAFEKGGIEEFLATQVDEGADDIEVESSASDEERQVTFLKQLIKIWFMTPYESRNVSKSPAAIGSANEASVVRHFMKWVVEKSVYRIRTVHDLGLVSNRKVEFAATSVDGIVSFRHIDEPSHKLAVLEIKTIVSPDQIVELEDSVISFGRFIECDAGTPLFKEIIYNSTHRSQICHHAAVTELETVFYVRATSTNIVQCVLVKFTHEQIQDWLDMLSFFQNEYMTFAFSPINLFTRMPRLGPDSREIYSYAMEHFTVETWLFLWRSFRTEVITRGVLPPATRIHPLLNSAWNHCMGNVDLARKVIQRNCVQSYGSAAPPLLIWMSFFNYVLYNSWRVWQLARISTSIDAFGSFVELQQFRKTKTSTYEKYLLFLYRSLNSADGLHKLISRHPELRHIKANEWKLDTPPTSPLAYPPGPESAPYSNAENAANKALGNFDDECARRRLDGDGHHKSQIPTGKKYCILCCKQCSKGDVEHKYREPRQTRTFCAKCSANLCTKDCFDTWHKAKRLDIHRCEPRLFKQALKKAYVHSPD